MIATGTDVKPIEVLIFLRDVRSELYFEQMKGRGVRTISTTDLRAVTPDADAKTRFVLIDAVGVTESAKTHPRRSIATANIAFDKLLEQVAAGDRARRHVIHARGAACRARPQASIPRRGRISPSSRAAGRLPIWRNAPARCDRSGQARNDAAAEARMRTRSDDSARP